MPGYGGVRPVDPAAIKPGMVCPHCEHLLRDPLQTDDGLRVCKSCGTDIERKPDSRCIRCGLTVVTNKCYPDRAIARDILKILVLCQFTELGCDWQGMLKDWERHVQTCPHRGELCPYSDCGQLVSLVAMAQHKRNCVYREDHCPHCGTIMQHHQLQDHVAVCDEVEVTCEHAGCGQSMKRKLLREHQLEECRIEQCLICQQLVDRVSCVEVCTDTSAKQRVHLSDPKQVFKHQQTLMKNISGLSEEITSLKTALDQPLSDDINHQKLRELFQQLSQRMNSLETGLERVKEDIPASTRYNSPALDKNLQDRVKLLEEQLAAIIKKQNEERRDQQRHPTSRALKPNRAENDVRTQQNPTGLEYRLAAVEGQLEELTKQTTSTQGHVQELELQLQASLASTHNGAFLWRIPNIARRRRDAVEERITSIYSPPFYTARNGYKMCVRAYLNGDGNGYTTHISLFFVIMKGEFDNLLHWPFEYKVSMILVDQNHRKHIVQTFKPSPESSSFQKPRSEMNVASGCPQFARLSVFDDQNYCKDDVMFIKCIVDTTRIFHP